MISLEKKYQTRSGLAVKVFTLEAGGNYPVIGMMQTLAKHWVPAAWSIRGISMIGSGNHPYDLVEIKETFDAGEWFVTVYKNPDDESYRVCSVHGTEAAARVAMSPLCIGIAKVKVQGERL